MQGRASLSLSVLAEILLTWEASPSASVIGYNVRRSNISGSGYTRLNASLLPDTSYRDLTVQSGHRYYYVATAVDSAGNESAPSNEAVADIP